MHLVITGAGGMVGARVAASLARDPVLGGRAVGRLTLADLAAPAAPAGAPFAVESVAADVGDRAAATRLLAGRPDAVLHLAAVVSGQAELDFDLGTRVNLDGTRWLLDAARALGAGGSGYRPRFVFASSIAVFGAPFPEVIPDDFHRTPLTSYGAQKAVGELLVSDHSRRGLIDGLSIRLPTICVRPGAPNAAASGFFSGIIREPLNGREAVLPVGDDVRHWHASPRSAVGFLRRALGMDLGAVGHDRALTMPGVAATVGEQLESLRRFGGDKALRLVRRVPDPAIAAIVAGWPRAFAPRRALALGFVAEANFDAIVRAHVEDELGGTAS